MVASDNTENIQYPTCTQLSSELIHVLHFQENQK